jgi:UDP-N-acetylglucosamine 4-epimerase
LNELFNLIRERVAASCPEASNAAPVYRDFRAGDVRHSLADIGKAKSLLGYSPTHSVQQGLDEAAAWYIAQDSHLAEA